MAATLFLPLPRVQAAEIVIGLNGARPSDDVVVVYGQWDGWANPPDRPWHLLSVANAVMGVMFNHNGTNDHSAAASAGLADAVLVSQTTNSLGGTTTTYVIPEDQLPLTRPLLQLGVPRQAVDVLDDLLRPVIAAGYSDMTPQLGPYFEPGRLVWPRVASLTAEPGSDEQGALTAGTTGDDSAVIVPVAAPSIRAGDATDVAAGSHPEPSGQSDDAGESSADEREISATEETSPTGADPADAADEAKPGLPSTDTPEVGVTPDDDSKQRDNRRSPAAPRDADRIAGTWEKRRAAVESRYQTNRPQRNRSGGPADVGQSAGLAKPAKPRNRQLSGASSSDRWDAGNRDKPATKSSDR